MAGPWRAKWMASSYEWGVVNSAGEAVAYVDRITPDDGGKANAQVLAAAPDLLEACRALVAGFGGDAAEDDPDIIQGRAAIAKAERAP